VTALSPEMKRELLLKHAPEDVAKAVTGAMQCRWVYGPHLGRRGTEEEHYEFAVEAVTDVVASLMPEHEDRAREIFGLLRWPEDYRSTTGVETFGPIPRFEKLAGARCATCGGTGVTGLISGIRCPDC
jgi:hypothetical protein